MATKRTWTEDDREAAVTAIVHDIITHGGRTLACSCGERFGCEPDCERERTLRYIQRDAREYVAALEAGLEDRSEAARTQAMVLLLSAKKAGGDVVPAYKPWLGLKR